MSDKLEAMIAEAINDIGEDPRREGLVRTPERAARALRYVTQGYGQNLEQIVNGAVFEATADDMVIVRDIEFYSMCEHHLFPFFGFASIAYIPNGKILGLSKFARITDMYARRLQVQERLTVEIADAIQSVLEPAGVAVVLQAQHLCMMARGVEKQSTDMVTSHVLGRFRQSQRTRAEFMELLARKRR